MTQTPSFRDVAQLSAYLDGQLRPSESASLESRLASEPELAATLEDLRQARGVLRQLPQRRAPRNFTLTPKMVGLKPPLPRSYPVFRLASVVATLLLFLSFATNFMAPRLAAQVAAVPYGIGGGGGGAPEQQEPAMALEAPAEPAEPAAPAEPATQEPEAMEEPAAKAPQGTLMPPAPESAAQPAAGTPTAPIEGESLRVQATAVPTQASQDRVEEQADESGQPAGGNGSGQVNVEPVQESQSRPVPLSWQIGLAVFLLIDLLILGILRRNAASKWRGTK